MNMNQSIAIERSNRAKKVREDAEKLKTRARQLSEKGYSNSWIAKELGVSEGTIINWFRKV